MSTVTAQPLQSARRQCALPRELRVAAAAVLALALSGCSSMADRTKEAAEQALLAKEPTQAVTLLEAALAKEPQDIKLKSALLTVKPRAIDSILDAARAAQQRGDLGEANDLVQRALTLDVTSSRALDLLTGLGIEARRQSVLGDAEKLAKKQDYAGALALITEALKASPANDRLQRLKSKLESDQRALQARSQTGLSEKRRVSLDFTDAGLRTVLDAVSRNSGINFVFDKDVQDATRVTVLLRNARVEDALELVVSTNKLATKTLDSRTIIVYPDTPEKRKEYQEQVVRVIYLKSAEAKGAAAFLKSMLKMEEPFVDERTNLLALRDSAEKIELAEKLLAVYDAGEPEVQLEVEVLEVSTSRLTELGVKFPSSFALTPLTTGTTGLTLDSLKSLSRSDVGVTVDGLTVNARREVGDVTTLANPKIRTKNKEKASILIGDKIPVVTTTTGGSGSFVSESVNYLDVGLKLNVEPTIYPNSEVSIKVTLEVSSLGSAVKTNSGTLAYQIGTRNANTTLRLRDGETQMLAGLISKDDRTTANRLPGAGDVPLVGRLFSDQRDSSQKTELVLAITPRVLKNIRPMEAHETELWIGTESRTKLRPVGGLRAIDGPSADKPSPSPSAPDQTLPRTSQTPSTPSTPADMQPAVAEDAPAQKEAEKTPAKPAIRIALSGPGSASKGEEVEVVVNLESSVGLRGIPLEFAFDATAVQFISAAEGPYFKRDGARTAFTAEAPEPGKLTVGVIRHQATTASGDGGVVTLKFKALKSGAATVTTVKALPLAVGAPAPQTPLPDAFTFTVK